MIEKRHYDAIVKACRHCKDRVTLTKAWTELNVTLRVGLVDGSKLVLSHQDREQLRLHCMAELELDPLIDDVMGDRVAAAASVPNEKWSREHVFAGRVQVISTQPIPLADGSILSVPDPGFTSLTISMIALSDRPLVLFENGALLSHWPRVDALFPEPLRGALGVYRGHDGHAKGAKALLKTAQVAGVDVYGYFDDDPAGYRIALDLGLTSILVPKHQSDIPIANLSRLHQQTAKYRNLADKLPSGWKEHYLAIVDSGHITTQEWMVSSGTPLTVLNA